MLKLDNWRPIGGMQHEFDQENIHSENMNGFDNNNLSIEGSKAKKKKTQLSAITHSQSQPSMQSI